MDLKFGSLGWASLLAGEEVSPYQMRAPAIAGTVTVSYCNKNPGPVLVRLAKGPGANSNAPGTRFLEFDAKVDPGIPLERTIAMSQGDNLFVMADTNDVDVDVFGFEKGMQNAA